MYVVQVTVRQHRAPTTQITEHPSEERTDIYFGTKKNINLKRVLRSGQLVSKEISDLASLRYPKINILYEYSPPLEERQEHNMWEYIEYCTKNYQVPSAIRNIVRNSIYSEPTKGKEMVRKLNLKKLCPSLANVDRATMIRKQILDELFGKDKITSLKLSQTELSLKAFNTKELEGKRLLFFYVRVNHTDAAGCIIHSQSYLQSLLASEAKFLVVDVKHGKNQENLYHFGIATYSENLRQSTMLARTRFKCLDSNSYQLAFEYFFNT